MFILVLLALGGSLGAAIAGEAGAVIGLITTGYAGLEITKG